MSLLIPDTSAVVVFAEGSIHVGEPIAGVHDDGGRVVVPVEFNRLDLAVALLTASTRDGFVLTGEPDSYGEPGARCVIPI